MSALLQAEGLSKSYGGVQALVDVSLTVAPGEVVALIGPNGAGKSTCFNCLDGRLRPDRGSVRFAGQNLAGLDVRRIWRLGVGRTFQIAAAFPSMTVRENVQVALLSLHQQMGDAWSRAPRHHVGRADELLAAAGLADLAARPAATLAYGDVKRLDLALGLANDPKLLLMDEPTAGMAPGERAALMRTVRAAAAARTMGVLFTEHDMDVVFGHADRVLVLHQGRLIAAGSPDDIRANALVRDVYLGQA